MVGIDFEYERAIIDRHLDFIERRLREREHEIEMLKNEVKVARLETEQAHEENNAKEMTIKLVDGYWYANGYVIDCGYNAYECSPDRFYHIFSEDEDYKGDRNAKSLFDTDDFEAALIWIYQD